MAERIYCMIIGDFLSSQKIDADERRNVQKKLKKVLNEINYQYDHYICSRFSITLGDEFQGGLYSSYRLFNILEKIKTAIAPHKIRVGIGFGTMSTDIKYSDSLESDGPAYYRAREQVEALKKIKTYEYGYAVSAASPEDKLINNLFRVIDDYSSKWTDTQKKYIRSLNSNEKLESVAARMEVFPSTVSRALNRAKYNEISKIISDINDFLFKTYCIGENQEAFIKGYNQATKLVSEKMYQKALEVIIAPYENNRMDAILYNILLSTIYFYKDFLTESFKQSLEYIKKAEELITYDYRYKKSYILNQMGNIYSHLNDKDSALDAYNNALEIVKYNDDLKIGYIYALGNKARIYSNKGKYDEAEDLNKEVYELILSELKYDYENQIRCLQNRGDNLLKNNKKEAAKKVFKEALDIANSYADQSSTLVANAKYNNALLFFEEKSYEEILNLVTDAMSIYKKSKTDNAVNACEDFLKKLEEEKHVMEK